jgi:hypothetical protein
LIHHLNAKFVFAIAMNSQDKELRYRFIYNHFPSLKEEVMILVGGLVARLYD